MNSLLTVAKHLAGPAGTARLLMLLLSALPGAVLCAEDGDDPAVQRSDGLPLIRAIEEAEQRLQEQEVRLGSFDTGLIEPLRGLAELQLSAGDLDEAEHALNRQLEIQRINLGLYSAAQIPVLESLLRLHVARRDWQTARDTISNLLWLHTRSDGISVSEQLAGMRRARAWLMLLMARDHSEHEASYLLMYRDASIKIESLAESRLPPGSPEQLDFIYEASKGDLALAMTIMQNPPTGQELIRRTEGIQSRGLQPGQTITSVSDLEQVYGARVDTVSERSFRSHMSEHTRKMEAMLDMARTAGDREAEAMLTLYHGDSVLLRQQYERRPGRLSVPDRGRGSLGTASVHYRDAFAMLAQLGYTPEQLLARFGCPTLLPLERLHTRLEEYPRCEESDTGQPRLPTERHLLGEKLPGFAFTPPPLPGGSQVTQASATLDVTVGTNGQIADFEIIEMQPDDAALSASLRRVLPDIQFRPALDATAGAQRIDAMKMSVRLEGDVQAARP